MVDRTPALGQVCWPAEGDDDDLEPDRKTVKDGNIGFIGELAPERERAMKICEHVGLAHLPDESE